MVRDFADSIGVPPEMSTACRLQACHAPLLIIFSSIFVGSHVADVYYVRGRALPGRELCDEAFLFYQGVYRGRDLASSRPSYRRLDLPISNLGAVLLLA